MSTTQSLTLLNQPPDSTKTSPDILVISRTFFPEEGGIQEYIYNRCLQDPERTIVLAAGCSGDTAFDQKQLFPVHRWSMPNLRYFGKLSSLIKQILNLFWSLVWSIKLYKRYHYRSIEWSHGYDFPSLLLLTYVLPVNFYIYLHGDDLLCPLRNPVLKILFTWTLKRSQGIICNSSFTRDYLQANFQIDTPIYVINPGVRPEKFGLILPPGEDKQSLDLLRQEIRQRYNIPPTGVVILTVGRLVKRKGCDRVIQTLPLLVARGVNIHYIICGRGPMETELKSLAESLGVGSRVHFAGYIADKELAAYYSACDIFAMVSFFDSKAKSIEGFGIVYREAGYFGKPAIASHIGGATDAVQHEENGLLVNPNSSEEIFQALLLLSQNKDLRQKLGMKGQQLALLQTLHSSIYQSVENP